MLPLNTAFTDTHEQRGENCFIFRLIYYLEQKIKQILAATLYLQNRKYNKNTNTKYSDF